MTPGHRRLGISVSPSHSYLYNISAHTPSFNFVHDDDDDRDDRAAIITTSLSILISTTWSSNCYHCSIFLIITNSWLHFPRDLQLIRLIPPGSDQTSHSDQIPLPSDICHSNSRSNRLPDQASNSQLIRLIITITMVTTWQAGREVITIITIITITMVTAAWQGGNHTAKPLITICLCHHWCTRPRKKKTKCGSSDGKKLCREILMGLGIGVLETSEKQLKERNHKKGM